MARPTRTKKRSIVFAGALGAALAYLFDPDRGRARRARTRDQFMGLTRRAGKRVGRLGRRIGSEAYGLRQRAAHWSKEPKELDDTTLAHKVESEIFRNPDIPKGQIVVNVEEGVVVLRGALPPEQAEAVASMAANIPGVRGVENLLHLPGTPAPNKAPAREASKTPGKTR
jgi:uncharacterized protein YunC (DUF1805 family)